MLLPTALTLATALLQASPLAATAVQAGASESSIDAATREADLVVYGGTSAGVIAAVRAARLGRSVVLVSADEHLGGLTSSGLGFTDSGEKAVIGGLAREFYARVFGHYADDSAWRWESRSDFGNRGQHGVAIDDGAGTMWLFEPHVAESIFEALLAGTDVRLVRGAKLERNGGVTVAVEGAGPPRIDSIRTKDGRRFRGRMFIDATYEGDLMAAAGVDYTVGRESSAAFGEEWNGFQPDARHHGHHFGTVARPVDPYVVPGDPASGLIPLVTRFPARPRGAGDRLVQSYCFRLCLTDEPANRVPFGRPDGYDPARYELVARTFEAGWRDTLPAFDRMPNRKTDANNHGPVSFDYVGGAHEYPEASDARRAEIVAEHEQYQRGLLYFLRTSPRVPAGVRAQMDRWGLAKDEFQSNGHWPYLVYVREARRMRGQFVMTSHDVLRKRPVVEPIGMGSYAMDSHNVQRYATPDGRVENEGDVGVQPLGPYGIAYGAILPRRRDCANLLVPVAVSATHIAYGSIRMEPVFMVLADSAALAAHLALEEGCAPQDLRYDALAAALEEAGQVLGTPASVRARAAAAAERRRARHVDPAALDGIVVDDENARREGPWTRSVHSARFVGPAYHHDGDARSGEARAVFECAIERGGRTEVRLLFPYGANRSTRVPVRVEVAGHGPVDLIVDQRARPPLDGLGVSLGRFDCAPGARVRVTVSNEGADGYVVADAVQILPR